MTASGTPPPARPLMALIATALVAGCTAIAPAQTADSGVHGLAYGDEVRTKAMSDAHTQISEQLFAAA